MRFGGRRIAALCGNDAGKVLERRIGRVLLQGRIGDSLGAGEIVALEMRGDLLHGRVRRERLLRRGRRSGCA